jgi:hypothetical protein
MTPTGAFLFVVGVTLVFEACLFALQFGLWISDNDRRIKELEDQPPHVQEFIEKYGEQ